MMKKYQEVIKTVLELSNISNDNDLTLVYLTHLSLGVQHNTPYGLVLDKIKNKELPSWDTITRLGRKIKKENPHLRGASYKERKTFKQEKAKSDLGY